METNSVSPIQKVKFSIMRRLSILALAACAIAMALPAGAQATSHNGVCSYGELCLFEHANLGGRVVFDRYAAGACWPAIVTVYGRNASSYSNLAGWDAKLWKPTGALFIGAWSSGNLPASFNDQVTGADNCYYY
jgi:hypothetical protein